MKIKVGFGFDVHQLQEGRDFIIGGVKIPHSKGALGHSDADALIHAICDALLGAAGLKDIGFYFPDTSAEFKGIDSKILLKRVVDLISEKGYTIGNVDVSLVLEKPKIKPYIDEMINTLAPILKVKLDDISIKATTNEKMGYVGREEGIAAYAVCLISKI
ncbi:MAG: 2-C-methyl-D-erythritol 2,4-cyclodiphosphate synthase [Bacteroidetes bacterium]|nr:2-C-methyl-D-erythritol 2,4-cyclodiphosphate synthase [Bacteroidota bacterium]